MAPVKVKPEPGTHFSGAIYGRELWPARRRTALVLDNASPGYAPLLIDLISSSDEENDVKIKTEPVGAMPAATAMPVDSVIDETDGDDGYHPRQLFFADETHKRGIRNTPWDEIDGDDDSGIRNTPWDELDGWELELVDDDDDEDSDGDSDGDGNVSDMSQE